MSENAQAEDEQSTDLWDVIIAQVTAMNAATFLIVEQVTTIKKLEQVARRQDAMIRTLYEEYVPSTQFDEEIRQMHQHFLEVTQ